MNNDKKILAWIFIAVALAGIIALMTGCKGCNKPTYIPPTPVQVIEQQYNPAIDSLKNINAVLKDSVIRLKSELEKQKQQTALAESKANQTSNRLRSALNEKDTGKVLVYAEDIVEELYYYRQETIRQDSIQDDIIQKQSATIETNRAEIELHETKFKELKTAFNIQSITLSDYARQNEKLHKKLKRAKFWNKVLGIGTAAGAALAGIMFL